MLYRRRGFLGSAAAFGLSMPLGLPRMSWAQGAPVRGGTAIVAMNAATETIDPHFSRSQAARNVLMHVFETLVTIDETGAPKLQLAEKLEVSADFRVYDFTLRQGVTFHNGKEMTAEDVKRSLERYAVVSPEKVRLSTLEKIETPTPSRVTITLRDPMPSWIEQIKSPASPITIIPAEECDKGPNEIATIGTGPFEFVDWDGATQLRLKRYEGYKPDEGYPDRDGYGGRREAYLDEVIFRVVSEAGSRLSGVQSGEITVADDIPSMAARRLSNDAKLAVHDRLPVSINLVPMNVRRAPTDNVHVRRAIQHALNTEEIMGIATDGAFRLNPAFVYPESAFYPQEAERLVYNVNDQAKAKALLGEGGYKGEPVILLTSADIFSLKECAVVMAEQMKAVGIAVDLVVKDWPGANAMRADPTSYNMFSTAFAIQPMLGPFQYQRLISGPNNWFYYEEDKVMEQAWADLLSAGSVPDQAELWGQIEQHLNDQAYLLKLGDRGTKQITLAKLQNFRPFDAIRMWNVWLG